MSKLHFTKMHGTGNDYVYVNLFTEQIDDASKLAVFVSDRHFGIGSDGLILIAPSKTADCRMIMYNADGSEGAMCGNGIRCVAKYAYEHGIVHSDEITIETKSGIKALKLTVENGLVTYITVIWDRRYWNLQRFRYQQMAIHLLLKNLWLTEKSMKPLVFQWEIHTV